MKGDGAIRSGGGGGLMRTRLRLPVVLVCCSLFFLAGFFGSLLFTQVPQRPPPHLSQIRGARASF
jgi:prolyl 4-hydroxylase